MIAMNIGQNPKSHILHIFFDYSTNWNAVILAADGDRDDRSPGLP